jgi:hypothetical protein
MKAVTRKSSVRRALALVVLTSCVSCGPSPVPERTPLAPLAIGPAAPPRPSPVAKPDPPPRTPDDLALVLRVADPEQLAREVVTLLPNVPGPALIDPSQLLSAMIGRKLASVVDIAQPIDIASVGAGPSLTLSLGVKSDAEATVGRTYVLKEEGGLVMITQPDDAPDDGDRTKACAFAPVAGRASTRLFCVLEGPLSPEVVLYLARGVSAEPLDADARLIVPGRVMRDKKDPATKAIGNAASSRLGNALIERFIAEIDRVDADLRFGGIGVEVTLNLRLTARESIVSKLLVARSTPAVPPPSFYRLPADSLVAMHTTGALAEDITPLRTVLAESIEATLVEDGYQRDKSRALRERLESLLLTGGPLVFGAGVVGGREGGDKALVAIESAHNKQDEAKAEAQARTALAPWLIFEAEEPAERWTQGLRDLVQRATDADKTRAPGSTSSTPRDPDSDHIDVHVGTVDAALKLPKDAFHLEILMTPRTKGKRPARKGHLFIVPKARTTWIGYSEDAAAIAARLRLALDDATEVGTLTKSPDVAPLRARPAIAAGLVSVGGVGHLFVSGTTFAELSTAARRARSTGLGTRGPETVIWTVSSDTTAGSVRASLRAETSRPTATALLKALGL